MAKESKVVLNVRAEFQNVLNRLFLSTPSNINPSAAVTNDPTGRLTGGYGYGFTSARLR